MSRSKSAKKTITLSASRDIPFDRLVLSQSNVRHVKAGVSIEELAEDIARRTLLSSITVRPVLNDDGSETGMFEIPAGGRRYRALELLVKQKRLAKDAPVPCIVRTGGLAEEDSLAENVQRAPLHPLDQYRAFLALREKGMSEEEIAASFFVSAAVVRQRLRLASVSPKLLDVYATDDMTLDQLMAFTVTGDHRRQEQVWEALGSGWSREPYRIRRMLTEGAVRATDRRARFVGVEEYEAAGGTVLRDLFQSDDGGWFQDAALLDSLVAEKLERGAELVRAEGWKWVEAAVEFPYGHTFQMRRIAGETKAMDEAEAAEYAALKEEYRELEEAHAADEELPAEVDLRLGGIEERMEALENRPIRFSEEVKAIAGAFVSIDGAGCLRIERGFVRPEDELRPDAEEMERADRDESAGAAPDSEMGAADPDDPAGAPHTSAEEDEGVRPLPDRLVTELTAHRTVALRDALAGDPQIAFIAALHALTLKLFYSYAPDTCLEIEPKSVAVGSFAPGLAETEPARSSAERHESWRGALPAEPGDLWNALMAFDTDSREALFAHCVSLTVNAVYESWNRRPRALAHADRLAEVLSLDMAGVGWRPTIETYLGRVTKGRILEAVTEACGTETAERIAHMKKPDMAASAEELLADTGWLPEPLRTREGIDDSSSEAQTEADESDRRDDAIEPLERETHPIAAE